MSSIRQERELACAYYDVWNRASEREQFLMSLTREEFRIVMGFASLTEEALRMKMHSEDGQKLVEKGLGHNCGNWSENLTVLSLLSRDCVLNDSSLPFVPDAVSYGGVLLRQEGPGIANESTGEVVSTKDVKIALADLRQVLLKAKKHLDNGSIAVLEALGIVAPDTSNREKPDITIWKEGECHNLSNKSFIGSSPSLLNYSKSANLVYDVPDLTKRDILELAGTRPKQWRAELQNRNGGTLSNGRFANPVFEQNLEHISPVLPKVYSAMLAEHILSGEKFLTWLVMKAGGTEELLCAFATAILSDITPAHQWDGTQHELLLSVEDRAGNVHVYNGSAIGQYLVPRMKFDVPSSDRSDNGFSWDAERNCAVLTAGFQIRLNAKACQQYRL